MANARDDLENVKNEIEYITRIDYVEPIVRDEVKQLLIDVYKGNTKELEHIDEYLQALEIIVKKNVDVEYLKTCIYSSGFIDLEEYNAYVDGDKELTRKEIELVAKVIKEIGEDEVK